MLSLNNSKKADSSLSKLDDIEQGPHRQIKNPAMKSFWRCLLNPNAKVELGLFIECCLNYIENNDLIVDEYNKNHKFVNCIIVLALFPSHEVSTLAGWMSL